MSNEQELFSGMDYRAKKKRSKKAAEPAPAASDPNKLVSYRIGSDLQGRIKAAAKSSGVNQAGLVKFLLTDALNRLDNGSLELPLKTETRVSIDI